MWKTLETICDLWQVAYTLANYGAYDTNIYFIYNFNNMNKFTWLFYV